MTWRKPTLQEFIRHANLYGHEEIYEVAGQYLQPLELAALVKELKSLPVRQERFGRRWADAPKFRLKRSDKVALAIRLVKVGVPIGEAAIKTNLPLDAVSDVLTASEDESRDRQEVDANGQVGRQEG